MIIKSLLAWGGCVAVGMLAGVVLFALSGRAQETDLTQTPNSEGAGIHKSFEQEVGAGRGDIMTPDSSLFIINRDPFRSIRRGREIFQRKFTRAQGQGPRVKDGIGPIAVDGRIGAGLSDSCAGCHGRPEGSAGHGGAVFTRPDSRDAPHLFGLGLVEMLADEITADLRGTRDRAKGLASLKGESLTVELESKGIRYGSLTVRPDGTVDATNVQGVNSDLRVRPFFADGREFSIRAFAAGAFQAEMGLQAVDSDLSTAASGGRVVTPSGLVLDGSVDLVSPPPAAHPSDDPDGDGVANEIPSAILDHVEFYLLNYFRPGQYRESEAARRGRRSMDRIGCTLCHVPDLVIQRDRRVADVDTVYDPDRGIFNSLFATATPRIVTQDDRSGFPPLKRPAQQPFVVHNIFADLKRHDLGPSFHERNFDTSVTTLFMTRALWGVASTAPYGHDGRSSNLREVILRHGGEAQGASDAFKAMSDFEQEEILQFLGTLVLFPPDSTASTLDPGDRSNPTFPQRGHGSIKLTALFNNPADPE
jgi:hypothetical protein